MNASQTPGTADHLKTITQLLDALVAQSEVILAAAQRLNELGSPGIARRILKFQGVQDELIFNTVKVYGDANPTSDRRNVCDTEEARDAAPDLLEALQAVSLTVAIHASQHPGDREAQQDLIKVRSALRKATTVRETPGGYASISNPFIDPANGGPGGTMGDAAAALPVCGCTVGNELHSRPLTRSEASTQGGAA